MANKRQIAQVVLQNEFLHKGCVVIDRVRGVRRFGGRPEPFEVQRDHVVAHSQHPRYVPPGVRIRA
jgi:hypothetical protein